MHAHISSKHINVHVMQRTSREFNSRFSKPKPSHPNRIIPFEEDAHHEDAQSQRERGQQVAGLRVLQAGRRVGEVRPSDIVRKPEALVPEPG